MTHHLSAPPSTSGHDPVRWHCRIDVEKHHVPSGERKIVTTDGNLLMYGGASALWDRLLGGATADFSLPYIGVGNGPAVNVPTLTDLAGASKFRAPMDINYPLHTPGEDSDAASVVFKSTFETTDANFAWTEIGVFNASSSGVMLNRRVGEWGTKTSSDQWIVTVTLTLA